MLVTKESSEKDVLIATLYGEARGEQEDEGLIWIVWVIRNRALLNKSYWGGHRIKDVCLKPGQFECWTKYPNGINMSESDSRARCARIVTEVLATSNDPTRGCDHYNNPSDEGYPSWTNNCNMISKIGNHQFYKSKHI